MKRFLIFFAIVIIIVCIIVGIYTNYKLNIKLAQKENLEYESYINEEITGTDLATLINKAMDSNEKNEIEKNENGAYISNDTNSINIDVEFIDIEKVYNMETIKSGEIENFVNYYSNIKFECTNIEYHKSTNKIKYMHFKQISK